MLRRKCRKTDVQLTLYVLAQTVGLLLQVLYIAMFLRAVLSWFVTEGNFLLRLLTIITEPIVVPVRMLLLRFRVFQEMPIDISFLVAFILLSVVQGALPVLTL